MATRGVSAYSHEAVAALLVAFADGATFTQAADKANVTRRTVYTWIRRYPDVASKVGVARGQYLMARAARGEPPLPREEQPMAQPAGEVPASPAIHEPLMSWLAELE